VLLSLELDHRGLWTLGLKGKNKLDLSGLGIIGHGPQQDIMSNNIGWPWTSVVGWWTIQWLVLLVVLKAQLVRRPSSLPPAPTTCKLLVLDSV
jgi:hypothetical protein